MAVDRILSILKRKAVDVAAKRFLNLVVRGSLGVNVPEEGVGERLIEDLPCQGPVNDRLVGDDCHVC